MTDYVVLRQVGLEPLRHRPTGATKHYHGAVELPPPSKLAIVRYPDDPAFYLVYLDEEGNELTDTYHDSQAQAMAQARWEFRLDENEWEVIEDG